MTAALKAGALYFAVVYGIGFALGTVRVLLLQQLVGEMTAVLLETPIMLLASWIAASWICIKFAVPPNWAARIAMGAVAFSLLMLGELAVSRLVFGRSFELTLAAYRSSSAILGLSAFPPS